MSGRTKVLLVCAVSLGASILRLSAQEVGGDTITGKVHQIEKVTVTARMLRGRIAVFLFDNKGEITQTQILDPKEGVYGAEIKAGTWHGLLVLESGSVIYEITGSPES